MRLLLDTCVLSELRKPDREELVVRVISALPDQYLYVSVLTVGEIVKGIALLDESKKKRDLKAWLLGLETQFEERILGIDAETAEIWGQSTAAAALNGISIPAVDGLIAATAVRHGLTVATRNIRHFQECGAKVINPWEPQL
jgi:predicted nucleic acid-binding protein